MNPWEIIGITPTVETRKIKLAYAGLIKKHNPEDDPDAFQVLRQAYEACLEKARRLDRSNPQPDTKPEAVSVENENRSPQQTDLIKDVYLNRQSADPDSIAQAIIDEAVSLYQDFHCRIDVTNWQRLFDSADLIRLDVKEIVNFRLFAQLVELPNLPKEVYALLDDLFKWSEQHIDLSGTLPDQLIDIVLRNFHYATFKHDYDGLKQADQIDFDQYIDIREEGAHELARNNLEKAESCFDQALSIYSDDPVLLFLLGLLAEKYSDEKTAVAHYSRVIELSPNRTEGYLNRAGILLRQNQTTAAMRDYQRLLTIDEKNIEGTRGLAQCHEYIGNLEEAKLLYEFCLEVRPADFATIIAIETLNAKLIQKYAAVRDKDIKRIKKLAHCYIETKQLKRAIKLLKKCPHEDSEIYLLLGQAMVLQKRPFEKTDNIFQRALQLADASGENGYEIRIARGKLLYRNGLEKDAALNFEKAWDINPNNADIANRIAESMHYGDGFKSEDALMWAERAIALQPEEWIFYQTKGTICYHMKRYRDSAQAMGIYIERRYNAPYARYIKGMSHYWLGQYEDSADALKMAQEMDRKDRDLPFFLAVSYFKIGRLDDACTQAALYQDKSSEGEYLRGFLWFKNGDLDQAIGAFTKGFEDQLDWDCSKALVCCYLQKENHDVTQSYLDAMYRGEPEDPWTLFHLSVVSCLRLQWLDCIQYADLYTASCDKHDEHIESNVFYYRTMAWHQLGNIQQAVKEGSRACKADAPGIPVMIFTSKVLFESGQIDSAIEILMQCKAKYGEADCEGLLTALEQITATDIKVKRDGLYETYFPDINKIIVPQVEPVDFY